MIFRHPDANRRRHRDATNIPSVRGAVYRLLGDSATRRLGDSRLGLAFDDSARQVSSNRVEPSDEELSTSSISPSGSTRTRRSSSTAVRCGIRACPTWWSWTNDPLFTPSRSVRADAADRCGDSSRWWTASNTQSRRFSGGGEERHRRAGRAGRPRDDGPVDRPSAERRDAGTSRSKSREQSTTEPRASAFKSRYSCPSAW
jgi:hypothetical protein